MPRLRLPRISLATLRERLPSGEHERLVLIAQIAAFVVVLGAVGTFVLVAATSGAGDSAAPARPQIPTITAAGGPGPTTTEPPPPPDTVTMAIPTTTTTTTTATTRAEVVKPKPRPKPRPRPTAHPPQPPTRPIPTPPPDGGVQTGVPWEKCSPEGAKGITKIHHLPLVCHNGRWFPAGIGR